MNATAIKREKRLFFPLTKFDWIDMVKNLRPAQLKVLGYIRAIAGPFGKKIEICIKQMAEELELNRSTVSRAIKSLEKAGYLNYEITRMEVAVSLPKFDWKTSTYESIEPSMLVDQPTSSPEVYIPHYCDRAIASSDQTITNVDQAIASPIYIDRAREDLKDPLDSPLPPTGENSQGRGGKDDERKPSQNNIHEDIAVLKEKVDMLTRCLDVKSIGHQGNISAKANGHQGEVIGFQAIGHVGNIDSDAHGHQGKVAGDLARGHEGNVNVRSHGHNGAVVGFQAAGHVGNIDSDADGHEGKVVGDLARGHSGNVSAHATGHNGNVVSRKFPDLPHLQESLLERIAKLEIPFDDVVIGALKGATNRQLQSTLAHIEKTRSTIKYPKSILLSKLQQFPKYAEKEVVEANLFYWQERLINNPSQKDRVLEEVGKLFPDGEIIFNSTEGLKLSEAFVNS